MIGFPLPSMQAGAAVVVTGGAGMGKTRLALETTAQIEAADIPCRAVAGERRAGLTAAFNELTRLTGTPMPSAGIAAG